MADKQCWLDVQHNLYLNPVKKITNLRYNAFFDEDQKKKIAL